jgi:hypothetical protein
MRIACFTSFTCAYLSRARVLAETLRAAHPDWHLTALLVDRLPDGAGLDEPAGFELAGFDAVVLAEALDIPSFPAWMFRHDVVEGCTAVKGRMLLRLLAGDVDAAIYLDPDIAVFHGLHAALAALRDASVVLTPHHTAPNDAPAAIDDNERTTLRYGVFNLGFLAVRNDDAGLAFARWWADRLHEACYDDPAAGLFTDQRYCDLVPGLFDRVHILRDAGSNVASWNLSRRDLAFDPAGGLLANGVPLGFYHFSKVDGAGDAMIERYGGANIVAAELLRWYRRRIGGQDRTKFAGRGWHYGQFADGTPIPRAARLLWRGRPELSIRFPDPFAAGADSLQAWLQREYSDMFRAPHETAVAALGAT